MTRLRLALLLAACATLTVPVQTRAQDASQNADVNDVRQIGDAAYRAMVEKIMQQPPPEADTGAPSDAAPSSTGTIHSYSSANAATPKTTQDAQSLGQKNDYVVTPVSSCYAKLPPDVALDIKLHSPHPYQDCQNAVANRLSEKRHYSAALEAAKLIPETPRNFVRVITPAAPAMYQTDAQTPPPAGGYWKAGGK